MKRIVALLCVVLLLVPFLGSFVTASAASPPAIHSQAAVVIDYETGEILYAKDAFSMRSPASMSKVMTAFITYEWMVANGLNLNTGIPVSQHARNMSNNGVLAGSSFAFASGNHSIENLLRLMMLPSSNSACIVMAERISGSEAAFAGRMNSTAQRLGLSASFVNPHGANRNTYNYITAHSMAMLLRTFIAQYPDILRITSMSAMSYNGQTRNQTNLLIRSGAHFYPGADGFKTGTTTEAGACLSSTAVRNGRRIIVVTMNAPNTNNQRYTDHRALLDFGFAEAERRGLGIGPTHPTFRDVPANAGYIPALDWAHANGIIFGSGGRFHPNGVMTRGDFVLILHRMAGNPPPARPGVVFSDVPASSVYYNPVAWAREHGIVLGSGGMFFPHDPIPRDQMATILYRYNAARGGDLFADSNALNQFSDRGQVPASVAEHMRWAVTHGMILGSGGRLSPTEIASREAAVTVLFRYNEKFGSGAGTSLITPQPPPPSTPPPSTPPPSIPSTPPTTLTFNPSTFADVPQSSASFDAVSWVQTHRIMIGSGGRFFPNDAMTRGDFLLILHRYAGSPTPNRPGMVFSDVGPSSVYYNPANWAHENGLVFGSGGRFFPSDPIPTNQMATILYRYNATRGLTVSSNPGALLPFIDRNDVPGSVAEHMRWAFTHDVITGSGGRLFPNTTATREAAATVLYRYVERFGH